MWNDLSNIWQEALDLAWESYGKGTVPIGAVIVDSNEKIIIRGRNRIFDLTSSNPLAGTYMAHAEMTALMHLKEREHPNVSTYKLYTTLEPCPMCFSTMVVMRIRNIHYAARDRFAGATLLNDKMDYIKGKEVKIIRENEELEAFQIILMTSYEIECEHAKRNELFASWSLDCPIGVQLGKQLYEEDYFKKSALDKKDISKVYDEVIERYNLSSNKLKNVVSFE